MQEYDVFGPPGTGKTRELATRYIPDAVEKYGKDKILVTSFTRTAAQELVNRVKDVDRKMIGTEHAICYRAFGSPKLAETMYKAWNEENPNLSIGKSSAATIDDGFNEPCDNTGSLLLSKYNIARAKMIPSELWNSDVKMFAKKWEDFKQQCGSMDFTDLITKALTDLPYAPGNPDVIFADEVQDFTPIQLKLLRSWGQQCKFFVLTGDDDQAIYNFSGATPSALLINLAPEFKRILKQSYRVPKKILERAMTVITRVSQRQEKVYFPRIDEETGLAAEGLVVNGVGDWKNPELYMHDVLRHIKNGKTVMLLATCSYMLESIVRMLKQNGTPFHNPYRTNRGDWNPLQRGSEKTTATDILVDFNRAGPDGPYWTVRQFVTWAKNLTVGTSGLIRKHGKEHIKTLEKAIEDDIDGLHTIRDSIHMILTPDAVQHALDRDYKWLVDNMAAKRAQGMQYPLQVMSQHGVNVLSKRPSVVVGTIHSVKGAEADVVYLFPDLSYSAQNESFTKEGADAISRLFYVGMTRAKETLNIMSPIRGSRGVIHAQL